MRRIQSIAGKVFSPEEREYRIITSLLCAKQGITVQGLAAKLFVNKNTIVGDISSVEGKIKAFGLVMTQNSRGGIEILGEEERIRNFFAYAYFIGQKHALITSSELRELLDCDWERIASLINTAEEKLAIQYSGTSKQELEVSIGFALKRSENDRCIYYSQEVVEKYRDKKEYDLIATMICSQKMSLSEGDTCFIVKLLMSAKIVCLVDIGDDWQESNEAKMLSKLIVQDSEEYLGTDLSNDFGFTNLLAIHMRVAIHRIRNGLLVENPLTEQIECEIAFIHEATKKIVSKYSKIIDVVFPEEEIAFIAMHIGAAYARNARGGFVQKKYLANGYKEHPKGRYTLKDIIPMEHTRFGVEINDWRQAVRAASEPLVRRGYCSPEYAASMIKAVEELGPYMVFIPGIAFVHSALENGVKQECISLINLKNEISFGDSQKAKVKTVVVFAARESSINMLTLLINILEKGSNLERLRRAASYEEIKDLRSNRKRNV